LEGAFAVPCAALALAAALATATPTPAAPLAAEPLFAEIVSRAQTLQAEARTLRDAPAPSITAFGAKAAALAELDMQGHLTLKARGSDGDLKCILKGIAEDLPRKVAALGEAKDPFSRQIAADEIVHLLEDNAEVVTQPPGPATPPPAE
jgi:hypothetical protein